MRVITVKALDCYSWFDGAFKHFTSISAEHITALRSVVRYFEQTFKSRMLTVSMFLTSALRMKDLRID